jgi:tetratricopeptide (TPR) repeat protein
MNEDSDPGVDPAEQALFEFLEAREEDQSVDFEAFCQERPRLAERLRRLLRDWHSVEALGGDLRAVLGTGESQAAADSGSAPFQFLTDKVSSLQGKRSAQDRLQILGEVGRGGMGAVQRVWDEDLQRPLAMKVMLERATEPASGRDATASLALARFLAEAQVTGQLDHPGVVPVHQLGVTAEGQVFFTMRLVEGWDLEQVFRWVRAGKDGWSRTRVLGILLKACEAVSYAHSKGVIHRDLKPANVMVGRFGETYVMDWGLARVPGDEELHDLSPPDSASRQSWPEWATRAGSVLGTPAYMSPEQALGRVQELGPRSDVYALGAMVYDLLAGHPPYLEPGAKLDGRQVLQRVRGGSPTPLDSFAGIPAELAAIGSKAMARHAEDRYADTQAMAEDLRAFLESRVVRAYETGALAEFRKWVARNRLTAASFALVLLVMFLGLAGIGVVQVRARREVEVAHAATAQQRDRADARAESLSQLVALLTQAFEQENPFLLRLDAEPGGRQGESVTVKEVMDQTAANLEDQLGEDPAIRAHFRVVIGEVYSGLGLFQEAEALLREALDFLVSSQGPDGREALDASLRLGTVLQHLGKFEAAESYLQSALEQWQLQFGEVSSTAGIWNRLGMLYVAQSRLEAAEQAFSRAWQIDQKTGYQFRVGLLNNLATVAFRSGRLDAAEEYYRQSLESAAGAASDHPSLLRVQTNLAHLYFEQRRFEEAEPVFARTLRILRDKLGAEHPETLQACLNLSNVHQARGEERKALALLEEIHERLRDQFGEEHPRTLACKSNLGLFYLRTSDYPKAKEVLTSALERSRRALPRRDPVTMAMLYHLAQVHRHQGNLAVAEQLLQEAVEVQLEEEIADFVRFAEEAFMLADLRRLAGRVQQAEDLVQQVVDLSLERLGEEHPTTIEALHRLGNLFWVQGRDSEAEMQFSEALELSEAGLGRQHSQTVSLLFGLAQIYEQLGDPAAAEPLAREAVELTARDHPEYGFRVQVLERIQRSNPEAESPR